MSNYSEVETAVNRYTYTGVNTLAFDYAFSEAEDLVVLYGKEIKSLNIDYTATASVEAEGYIELITEPEDDTEIIIIRRTQLIRATDFSTNARFTTALVDSEYDQLLRQISDARNTDTNIRVPDYLTGVFSGEIQDFEAGSVVVITEDGLGIETRIPTELLGISDALSEIEGYAESASTSETNAYNSEVNAESYKNTATTAAQSAQASALIASQGADAVESAVEGLIENTLATSTRSAPIEFIDNQYDYTISGFNASIASYYIYHPEGSFNTQLLVPDLDYTYDSTTTETITLSSSWSGGYILARVLDPAGTGTYVPPSQYTSVSLFNKTGLQDGTEITISDLGYSKFIISDTASALVGDITLDSGQVAVLQKTMGMWNVESFGAYADPTDSTIQDSFFAAAAERCGDDGMVLVPSGRYKLTESVPTSVLWNLMPDAEIIGLGGVAPTFSTDTTYLTGAMIRYQESKKNALIYAGETDYATQKARGKGLGNVITGISHNGNGGVLGSSLSSKSDTENQSCIGVSAIVINDNTNVARTAWGLYTETVQDTGAGGNTFGHENAIASKNTFVSANPNSGAQYGDGYTVGDWCSVGIGGAEEDVTAWKACLSVAGQFDKGMIIFNGSLRPKTNYKELIATEQNSAIVWYPTKGVTNDDTQMAYIKATDNGTGLGNIRFSVSDVVNDVTVGWAMTTEALSPTATNTSDIGNSSVRVKSIYLTNSPDVSSDETLKEQQTELSASEKATAIAIAKLPRMFKWIDEVSKSETGTAYLHCSPMAQAVWSAFEDNGLDPTNYGFMNDGGEDSTMSLQPQEILWMICAAQQEQIEDIQTRLLALEG